MRDAPPWVDCRRQQVARAAEEQDPKPFAHPGNSSKVRGVTPICPPKKHLLIKYLFGTVTGVCKEARNRSCPLSPSRLSTDGKGTHRADAPV